MHAQQHSYNLTIRYISPTLIYAYHWYTSSMISTDQTGNLGLAMGLTSGLTCTIIERAYIGAPHQNIPCKIYIMFTVLMHVFFE